MDKDLDLQKHVLGPMLTHALWSWSHHVFRPALLLQSLGLYRPIGFGTKPAPRSLPDPGPRLSQELTEPLRLEHTPGHYDSIAEFDRCADEYEQAVKPFSQPVSDAMLMLMLEYLTPTTRILDPSCGPGVEASRLARLLPEGEVVAADLSLGMVETAWRSAQREGLANMAFVQADVGDPPPCFDAYFDLISCCLAFHHYPDGLAAARAFKRVLKPGGLVFVADPGPQWYNDMSAAWAKLADPGFVQHRNAIEFHTLFRQAGFSQVYWVEVLPGIGLTIAST